MDEIKRETYDGMNIERFKEYIREDENIDDLELDGLYILQKKNGFKFGTDAVLLSYFTNLKNKESVMDFCTGSGILPLLFAGKSSSKKIVGIEIQEKYSDMAKRSVKLNKLEDRVFIYNEDLKNIAFLKSLDKVDVVTANPPYKKDDTGIKNINEDLLIARHEVTMNLEDLIIAANTVLKDQGRLCLVHRPERMLDIVFLMRKYKIEPKRIRMVSPNIKKAPNMILIEGVKGAKPYLKWEEELRIYNEDSTYTEEIKMIYGDERHG